MVLLYEAYFRLVCTADGEALMVSVDESLSSTAPFVTDCGGLCIEAVG